MNDALKELFNAYKHLPVGVMFFKEEKLFFVNDYLRNALLLANLPSDEVIHIIGDVAGLETSSHSLLNDFLSNNDILLYHDQAIQIERYKSDEIDVFVLAWLSDKAIDVIDSSRSLRELRRDSNSILTISLIGQEELKLLRNTLGQWEGGRFPSIVLYKGIPIKGDCKILGIDEGRLKLKVEQKQLISAHVGIEWLIGYKQDKMLSGHVQQYDIAKSSIWLVDIKPLQKGYYLRSLIRYEVNDKDVLNLSLAGKHFSLSLHDVSEKGISIYTDNATALLALSSITEKSLDAELILEGKPIAIKAVWLYTVAIDASSSMKAAFIIEYDLHNGALLREWLNAQQLRLIKEVRNFVQMIPPPAKAEDWVI